LYVRGSFVGVSACSRNSWSREGKEQKVAQGFRAFLRGSPWLVGSGWARLSCPVPIVIQDFMHVVLVLCLLRLLGFLGLNWLTSVGLDA
jgi:hypothetical protein